MKNLIAIGALTLTTLAFASTEVDICHEPIKILELQLAEQEDPINARVLQYSMLKIQQYCQQKYGQQQQQMQELSEGQIVDPKFNPLLVCEARRNLSLRTEVARGNCLQPTGKFHHQPQDGSGCEYTVMFLKLGEDYTLNGTTYICE